MGHVKRRRLLVSHAQVRLVAFSFAHDSLLARVRYVDVRAPLSRGIVDRHLSSHERAKFGERPVYLHSRLQPMCMGAGVIFAFHKVLLSHRIVRPFLHFCNVLRGIGKGRLDQQIPIYKGGDLHNEARVFDEMRESLRMRLPCNRSIHADADRTWRLLSNEIESGLVEERARGRIGELAQLSSSEWKQHRLDTHRNQNGSEPAPTDSDIPYLGDRHRVSEKRLAS